MAPLVVIEVLDERGGVRSRTRLAAFPATIGRGYDSQVIVDDPYACARHLRVVEGEDGGLVAEDAGSVNGTWLLGGHADAVRERVERVPLAAGTELRVGRTVLRVRMPDEPVPATLVDRVPAGVGTRDAGAAPAGGGIAGWRPSTRASVGVAVAAYAAFAVHAYFTTFERTATAAVVLRPLANGWLLGLWAGVWALAGRATSHRFSYAAHLAVAVAAGVSALALVEGVEWLEFLIPDNGLVYLCVVVAAFALVAGLLAAHLAIAAPAPRRALWRRAVTATAALAGLIALVAAASDDEFSIKLDDPGQLKPASGEWARSVDVAGFMEEAAKLRARTDSLAAEPSRAADGAQPDSARPDSAGGEGADSAD